MKLLPAVTMGLGAALCLWWLAVPRQTKPPRRSRLDELISEAGLTLTPLRVVASCWAIGLAVGALVYVASQSVVVSLAIGSVVAPAPIAYLKHAQRRRHAELRAVWPDAIEHLASGIRAGLSLPEAIGQLAVTGPETLRPAFSDFAADYRASGQFTASLERLKDALADPVGDRVVETLRLAREVGGSDLGKLLRTLAAFLRDDARVRGELESRQSWTVNAARLAVAAPWVLLVLLSTRGQAVSAYNSAAGVLVLTIGAAVSVIAFRLMVRIGRLPTEARVLR
jgi:tight adherence protein B